ncbi:hypothetical protein SB392_005381 [Escherichia coli]|nr:hypothetical protein [Escherichia coli]EKF5925367.1 hypothetical protein [Escherichia coli]ELU4746153.1 hypothetical protein [Escherichia coli]
MNIDTPSEFFASQVAEAYVLHLIAVNRRPVYRYSSGDIEVNRHFLMSLLEGYLREKHNEEWRCRFYIRLLDRSVITDPGVVFCGGKPPRLKRTGIRYMNALVHKLGDMLEDIGGKDADGRMTMPVSWDP